jgi:hypothetical protein
MSEGRPAGRAFGPPNPGSTRPAAGGERRTEGETLGIDDRVHPARVRSRVGPHDWTDRGVKALADLVPANRSQPRDRRSAFLRDLIPQDERFGMPTIQGFDEGSADTAIRQRFHRRSWWGGLPGQAATARPAPLVKMARVDPLSLYLRAAGPR